MADDNEVLGVRRLAEPVSAYLSKDEMLAQMQASVDEMIKAGKFPPGCVVTDVRIRSVDFLVRRPSDGLVREITATILSEDEVSGPANAQSFFAPSSGTKQ